jgi:hypothetical protein
MFDSKNFSGIKTFLKKKVIKGGVTLLNSKPNQYMFKVTSTTYLLKANKICELLDRLGALKKVAPVVLTGRQVKDNLVFLDFLEKYS